MRNKISEGSVKFLADTGAISKKLEVFYNPVMKYNRDVTIAIINAYFEDVLEKRTGRVKVGLPLAGTGVRGLRILKECKVPVNLYLNDLNKDSVRFIKKNLRGLKKKVFRKKADFFLQENAPFDYIDIDPFGSSIPFIQSAINALYNEGIIAVTNTDTAALCGSYPKVTRRRYGSVPFNFAVRQEFGLRILIKKIQEIGAMFDIALVPIFSYSKDHYMRVFFRKTNSKKLCDEVLKQHVYMKADKNRFLEVADKADLGPIYIGDLFDRKLTKKLSLNDKFSLLLKEEAEVNQTFFYDPHELAKLNKKNIPSYEKILEKIEKAGYKASRTHFYVTGIKTDMPKKKFLNLIK